MNFPELVTDVIAGKQSPTRCKSRKDYEDQHGGNRIDGEQDTSKRWVAALRDANGGARLAMYGVPAGGGEGGGFTWVCSGKTTAPIWHEWGHCLSLPHWGDVPSYPYRGPMFGISAPSPDEHVGPVWAYDPVGRNFIPCRKQGTNPLTLVPP